MTGKVKKLFMCGSKSFRSVEAQREEDEAEETEVRQLPEGRIRVCVGRDGSQQKFDMEAGFLNHTLFRDLLRLSEDEFGYSYSGAVRIACDVDLFLHLVELLRSSNPAVHYMALPDLLANFSTSNCDDPQGNSGSARGNHRQ